MRDIIKPNHYPDCSTCPIAEAKVQQAHGASKVKVRCIQLPDGEVRVGGQYYKTTYKFGADGMVPLRTEMVPLPRTTTNCPPSQ